MDYAEMSRVLNSPKASREQLRTALASALGVEYAPPTKEKQASVFNECKAEFCSYYSGVTGLTYTFTGQDAKSLKELIDKMQTLFNYASDDHDVSAMLKLLLVKMPAWYKQNAFSLPVINKKFNEIVSSIKANNGKGQTNISSDYKQKLINDLQA